MIKFLSDKAICMCPHGGKLQFISTHMKADGMDGPALTIQEYQNAMIVGCAMPPPPAGMSPCLKVMSAIDPLGRAMKIQGINAVTQMVVSFTDKGWPIMVVNPGMSAMSITIDPSIPSFRKAQFAVASAKTQSGVGIGTGEGESSSTKPWKDVVSAFWQSDALRRGETATLGGTVVGFGDGTPATMLIHEYDLEGNHEFVARASGTVRKNRVEAEWSFEYAKDVTQLPDMFAGDEFYSAPSYFFDLKVGGKSAQSGLIEFRDFIEVELTDEEGQPLAMAEYVVHFADGSTRRGLFDREAKLTLDDIPPGNVYWTFAPQVKEIVSTEWSADVARNGELMRLVGSTRGYLDGTAATFRIFEHDGDGAHDLMDELAVVIENDAAEATWEFVYEKDLDDLGSIPGGDAMYLAPEYFFELQVEGQKKRSPLLTFKDWIEIELANEHGHAIPGLRFVAHFADGTKREGTLDSMGRAKLTDIPPGSVHVEVV